MHKLPHNTLLLLLNNVGSAVLSFVLSVMIGRALGEVGLGIYATALAWVFALSLVAEFGIGTLLTRDVAHDGALADQYLRAASLARLWLGGGLTLALVILAPLLSDNPQIVTGLQISAPLVLILPLFGNYTAIFRAQQQMWPIPWLNLGMLAAQVGLTALIFALGGNVMQVFLVNTATSAGQLVTAWWIWRRWFAHDGRGHNGVVSLPIGTFMRAAWPFAIAGVLAAIQTRMGTVFLERITDTSSVGQYTAAMRFVEAGRMIPNAVFGAIFPMLVSLASSPQGLQHRFRKLLGGLTAYSILLGALGIVFAPILLATTFGAQFAPAAAVLQVAMWSLLPSILRSSVTLYWYALKRERFANWLSGVGLLVQFMLSLILIPRYSVIGAVGVNIIVDTAVLLIMVGYSNKNRRRTRNH
jgi:O-antigen/teichoic acid export membrane protein